MLQNLSDLDFETSMSLKVQERVLRVVFSAYQSPYKIYGRKLVYLKLYLDRLDGDVLSVYGTM